MKTELSTATQCKPAKLDANGLPDADQEQLAFILDHYLRGLEQGQPITPEALLQQYPDYAPYLRGYLSGLELFHREAVAARLEVTAPAILWGRSRVAGERIGDFEIVREIGRGGMGIVYEARQLSLRRRVALKILPFSAAGDTKRISRFCNEAQAAAQIQHPHIVPVYAIGEEGGLHYYVMQLIEGRSLTQLLAGQASTDDRAQTTAGLLVADSELADVPPTNQLVHESSTSKNSPSGHGYSSRDIKQIARIGMQAAQALHAAHEYGIVHRDVKPSNLLIDEQGKAWVTDFGLARFHDHDHLTQTGDILGTMRYMSPEQALGSGGLVDHRADIYSLAVTLYEMATTRHPADDLSGADLLADRSRFRLKPLRQIDATIPVDFQTIVLKAAAETPAERYDTAAQFAEDLRRFLAGEPILASPPSWLNRATKFVQRHRNVAIASAVALLLVSVSLTYYSFQTARQNSQLQDAVNAKEKNYNRANAILDRFGESTVNQLETIPGAEGVRYQLLEDCVGYYEDLASQAEANPALATDLALAFGKLGSLSEKLGKRDEALDKYQAALALWEAKVREQPGELESQRNLALCQNNLGLFLAESGQPDAALSLLEQAESSLKTLYAANSGSAILPVDLGTTYSNLGLVLSQTGGVEAAKAKFRAAVAMLEAQVDEQSSNEPAERILAATYNNLGSLIEHESSSEVSATYYKAIELQRKMVEAQPVNRIFQAELARTYNNLGYVLARDQGWEEAADCYENAINLQLNLVKLSPLHVAYRRDLAISYNNLGMVQTRRRQFLQAQASFEESLRLHKLTLAADPQDAKSLSDLGSVYNNLGLLGDQRRQFTQAEKWYQQAIACQRNVRQTQPENPHVENLLKNHYANYLKCLLKQNKLDAVESISLERDALLLGCAEHSTHTQHQN